MTGLNFYVILMNSTFSCCYVSLVLILASEFRLKLNSKVSRILQSDDRTSFHDRILVLNLLQLLLSLALVATVRLFQKCPYPATDYTLGCWLMLLVKLLHLRRETFLQDLVGILSLGVTALVSQHFNSSSGGSVLETASSLLNVILFTAPPPVIMTLVLVACQALTVLLTLSLPLSAGLLCILCISVLQRNWKLLIVPLCILLLQFGWNSSTSDQPLNENHKDEILIVNVTDADNRMQTRNIRQEREKCENDPLKRLTVNTVARHVTGSETLTSVAASVELREFAVISISSLQAGGDCKVVALDVTGRNSLTKYLVKLLNDLLPSLELVPRVSLSGVTSKCTEIIGSEIITKRGNQSCHFVEDEIVFRKKSFTTRLMSFLSRVKKSVLDQFL